MRESRIRNAESVDQAQIFAIESAILDDQDGVVKDFKKVNGGGGAGDSGVENQILDNEGSIGSNDNQVTGAERDCGAAKPGCGIEVVDLAIIVDSGCITPCAHHPPKGW